MKMMCPHCGKMITDREKYLAMYEALKRNGWSRTRTAEELQISVRLIRLWIKELRAKGVPVAQPDRIINGQHVGAFHNGGPDAEWEKGEIKYLTQSWGKIKIDHICFVLQRSIDNVLNKARSLGLMA